MRSVRKGAAHLYVDGTPYARARDGLVARLGSYCSYCERRDIFLEVEHLQPKSIHHALECVWTNFLLSCKNCNATKSTTDNALNGWLIPDRDNTMLAFVYGLDGTVLIAPTVPAALMPAAQATIDLFKLNRKVRKVVDDAGNLVALDRRTQRLEAWLQAKHYRAKWDNASADLLADAIVDLAKATGFFSIWMAAFDGVELIRRKLMQAFPGTETACFDPVSTVACRPHPNTDALAHGGKL